MAVDSGVVLDERQLRDVSTIEVLSLDKGRIYLPDNLIQRYRSELEDLGFTQTNGLELPNLNTTNLIRLLSLLLQNLKKNETIETLVETTPIILNIYLRIMYLDRRENTTLYNQLEIPEDLTPILSSNNRLLTIKNAKGELVLTYHLLTGMVRFPKHISDRSYLLETPEA